MGIKGLWSLLTPFGEKKSLHEIRGETIVVDLSGWVCDSQNVADHHAQPKLYLRNLFFRTVYLLLAEVTPIFVLEGDAPEMKRDVMAARNAVQFKGTAPRSDNATKKKPNVARRQFRYVLRECESLLKCMGVSCIKGQGEAEATCAALNAQGMADAVVSQDSDCFAYGARRVYRNFSVSSAAGGGALQGSIDCYDAVSIKDQNGFGRNKMVALALLCGCDYGAGACGSSTGTVIAFLHTVDETQVISRLQSWVNEPEKYEELQRWVTTKGRCDRCGHLGRTHGKNGCHSCGTTKACNDTGHKVKLSEVKRELSLRTRALSSGMQFPDPAIMTEFLNQPPEELQTRKLKPSTPSLIEFVKLMKSKLDWNERYCLEKFLPVLTRCHLQRDVAIRTIIPQAIKKKRNPRGVPSFEVLWSDLNGHYEGLIPDDQFESDEDPTAIWTTIERQDLMRTFYPELVEAFEESIKKPQKEKKSRKKKDLNDAENQKPNKPKRKYNKKKVNIDNDIESIRKSMGEVNLSCKESKANVSVKVSKLKRKHKNTSIKSKNQQKTIHSFLSKRKKSIKSIINSFSNISLDSVDKLFDDVCLQNKLHSNKENLNVGLKSKSVEKKTINILDFSQDDVSENDLSNIVDDIVSSAPVYKTASVNSKLVRLIFAKKDSPKKTHFRKSILNAIQNNSSTPKNSPDKPKRGDIVNKSLNLTNHRTSTSFFFDKFTDERDAFEMSVDYKNESYCDNDKTLDYSINNLL